MLRTCVSACDRRPVKSVIWGHARVAPEGVTFTTDPFRTRHFLIRAEHRADASREEGARRSRVFTQIKARTGFIFSVPRS
jgi:hypothetical protein